MLVIASFSASWSEVRSWIRKTLSSKSMTSARSSSRSVSTNELAASCTSGSFSFIDPELSSRMPIVIGRSSR